MPLRQRQYEDRAVGATYLSVYLGLAAERSGTVWMRWSGDYNG